MSAHSKHRAGHGKHEQWKKKQHTSTAGAFGQKFRNAWKEGSKRHGFYGLQFAFEAINPFFWLNLAFDSRREAKMNRGLKELHEYYKRNPEVRKELAELRKDQVFVSFFSTDRSGIDVLGTQLNNDAATLSYRLRRIKGDMEARESDKPENMEKLGINTRLSPQQIEGYMKFVNERNEVMASYRALLGRYSKVHEEKDAEKFIKDFNALMGKYDEMNRKYFSKPAKMSLIALATIEAEAIRKIPEKK